MLAEADLAVGDQRVVRIGFTRVLLVRGERDVHAVPELCPHAMKPLTGGGVDGNVLTCPAHGAKFDLATGTPVNPVCERGLMPYPVRVRAGRIEIQMTP